MNWFKRTLSKITEPNSNSQSSQRDPCQSNAYDLIGGDHTIKAIAASFYQFMDSDPQVKPLRVIHPDSLTISEEKLYEFLSGWLGGPQLFQQKYGNPALRARHMPFAVDETMRDQWLMCFEHALNENVTQPEHRQAIFQAVSTLADHMRNQPSQS
ncbi:group II truncated hemoglobin [Shewanella sp. 202IG2-18]|uniref:group II truncated hemoglobin n=1 Tax=Parashewanella hymeniacidonis TaxID=2807618 RepID=UPI00195FE7A6|nr:group II truncated hemoglobin [Parashewanella hymeniacidonis]MBM7073219.1 group II truncated hemoglobin [Parashewanella hymeniacidonis]